MLIDTQAPKTFDELIGQPVASTLFKKWSKDHSKFPKVTFLVGESGRGKTTSIKLLSALATCKTPTKLDDQIVPCGECEACRNVFEEKFSPAKHVHFFSGRAANVDLIDRVEKLLQYAPVGVEHSRIVIFDELQDASKGFMKALLSTLEKKGTKTKFIIATMDPKSLKMSGSNPTALTDRGTVVKFGKIKPAIIVEHLINLLDNVIDKEQSCPDEFITSVVSRIAKEANGSMRRAVSLLDTCFEAEAWTDELADAVLMDISEARVDDVLKAILDKSENMFEKMDELDSYEELYRLANAKMNNAMKKFVSKTLDAGDFYSNKCQEAFQHKNFNELRTAFRRVHAEMGSYWRNDIFESIICDFALDTKAPPLLTKEEPKTTARRRR